MLGAQFIDLIWPTLLLLGVEHVELAPAGNGPPLRFTDYPVSHSLLMVLVWAALFGGLVAFLLVIHAGNIFGAPPPSVAAVAWVGHAQWLLVLWGYWIDRHRTARSSADA